MNENITDIKSYNVFDLLSYIIAYIGILLTIRIYFAVRKDHTESLDDFIRVLTEIIDLSEDDEEIQIYTPTLFLNQAHIINKTANYRNTSYRNKLQDKKKLKITLLKRPQLEKIYNSSIKNKVKYSKIEKKHIYDNDYYNFLCNFRNDKSELMSFHNWSLKLEIPSNDETKISNYYKEFILFMKSIDSKINLDSYKFKTIPVGNSNKYSGPFGIANFIQGLYFIGSFEASADSETFFKGTFFRNKHIKDQMKGFFNNLLNGNSNAANS